MYIMYESSNQIDYVVYHFNHHFYIDIDNSKHLMFVVHLYLSSQSPTIKMIYLETRVIYMGYYGMN